MGDKSGMTIKDFKVGDIVCLKDDKKPLLYARIREIKKRQNNEYELWGFYVERLEYIDKEPMHTSYDNGYLHPDVAFKINRNLKEAME